MYEIGKIKKHMTNTTHKNERPPPIEMDLELEESKNFTSPKISKTMCGFTPTWDSKLKKV